MANVKRSDTLKSEYPPEYRKLLPTGCLLYVVKIEGQGWVLMCEGNWDNAYRTAKDAMEAANERYF